MAEAVDLGPLLRRSAIRHSNRPAPVVGYLVVVIFDDRPGHPKWAASVNAEAGSGLALRGAIDAALDECFVPDDSPDGSSYAAGPPESDS